MTTPKVHEVPSARVTRQPPALAAHAAKRRRLEAAHIRKLLALLRPEDRRKVAYIEAQLATDREEDRDLLIETRDRILRSYTALAS